jgi:hypothetical protein
MRPFRSISSPPITSKRFPSSRPFRWKLLSVAFSAETLCDISEMCRLIRSGDWTSRDRVELTWSCSVESSWPLPAWSGIQYQLLRVMMAARVRLRLMTPTPKPTHSLLENHLLLPLHLVDVMRELDLLTSELEQLVAELLVLLPRLLGLWSVLRALRPAHSSALCQITYPAQRWGFR